MSESVGACVVDGLFCDALFFRAAESISLYLGKNIFSMLRFCDTSFYARHGNFELNYYAKNRLLFFAVISKEPARLWCVRSAPVLFALKWFCPGFRATILPLRVTRSRFKNDLLVFILYFLHCSSSLGNCIRRGILRNRRLRRFFCPATGRTGLAIGLDYDREPFGSLPNLVGDFI